jgi:3-methyladenine DNA glycosylase/8-oxoguanine DNA glycosylase
VPNKFTIQVPPDYLLRRDACSYGYFLLAPNHWDPTSGAFYRVLDLAEGPVLCTIRQPVKTSVDPSSTTQGRPKRASARAGSARSSPGTPLFVTSSRKIAPSERREAERLIARILRLDEGTPLLREFHKTDLRWKKSGRGRLMRSPTFFEDVIKTVTSCNVTWPSTVNMNRRLCEVMGAAVEQGPRARPPHGAHFVHSFPSARRLAAARPATLRARCSVGYRDARIVELARLFVLPPSRGGIDSAWFESPGTTDEAIHGALLELPGIGPYAAANIMQLLGRYSRLPLDTESLRHAKAILGMTGSDREILKRMHAHYAPFGRHAFRSYWLELWDFYESQRGPAWTWERETTGKSFTAALLKERPAKVTGSE